MNLNHQKLIKEHHKHLRKSLGFKKLRNVRLRRILKSNLKDYSDI